MALGRAADRAVQNLLLAGNGGLEEDRGGLAVLPQMGPVRTASGSGRAQDGAGPTYPAQIFKIEVNSNTVSGSINNMLLAL